MHLVVLRRLEMSAAKMDFELDQFWVRKNETGVSCTYSGGASCSTSGVSIEQAWIPYRGDEWTIQHEFCSGRWLAILLLLNHSWFDWQRRNCNHRRKLVLYTLRQFISSDLKKRSNPELPSWWEIVVIVLGESTCGQPGRRFESTFREYLM